jgi:hypothetical protein
LLDYLASQFMEQGWSLKHTIRTLVLSRTYQLASDPSPAARELDPTDRFLSHFRVRRLESESIRDSVLFVSGSLDETREGPPVGPNGLRRSVYVRVDRAALAPFLEAFDAPQPFTTQGRRDVTNVPAQSLTAVE